MPRKSAKKKVLDAVGIEPTTFHKYAHWIMRSDFDDVSLISQHGDICWCCLTNHTPRLRAVSLTVERSWLCGEAYPSARVCVLMAKCWNLWY